MEGPIFGGAYLRREICVSKSIGLACSGKEIYHFCFVLLCIRGQIPSTSPPRGLYSEGRFNGGFFALRELSLSRLLYVDFPKNAREILMEVFRNAQINL